MAYKILLITLLALYNLTAWSGKTDNIVARWEECYSNHTKNIRNGKIYQAALKQAKERHALGLAPAEAATMYLSLADKLIQNGEYTAALQIVQQMQTDANALGIGNAQRQIFIAECENRTGLCFSRLGVTDRAMEYFNNSRKRLSGRHCPLLESKIINNIGEIYYRRGSIRTAIDLQEQAIEVILPEKDSTEISAYHNNLGILYMRAREYRKAREHFAKAVDYHKANDNNFLSYIYTNMAELSEAERNYAQAMKELGIAMRLQAGKPLNENILTTKIGLAKICIKTNKLQDFKRIKDRLAVELEAIGSDDYRADGMRQLSDLCFCIGDSATGARLLIKADRIRDSIRNSVNEYQLQQMLVAYDTERLQNNNLTLKQSVDQLQLKARNRNLTIAICLVLLILFGVLISMLVRKNKTASLIHEQQERLRKYEQEEHMRKEMDLRNTIDTNNRRLTEYAIDQSAVNEFQQRICKRIECVMRGDYPDKRDETKALGEIVQELKHQKDSQLGEDFHTYFEQVNPDFLRKIKSMFPQLTQNDVRLCAFLYLGLSTKEIAALTYREVRSIETSRLRLRKKLGLEAGASLHDFLISISV